MNSPQCSRRGIGFKVGFFNIPRSVRLRLLGVAACLLLIPVRLRAEEVALTFDDLPTLSLTKSFSYADTTTVEILDGLQRHSLPATGFVNEGKLEGDDKAARTALLEDWLDAGMDLGNHGYSHLSLNRTSLNAYIADVERGSTVTSALLHKHGKALRWYRYPYLETGLTRATRDAFEKWLTQHDYRVAPVTIENSDWMFALPYDSAVLLHDDEAAQQIRQSYLAYTARIVRWYREAALALLGRRPALVFLLHASRLNADSVGALAVILENNDLKAVTLDKAMGDPAYSTADTYVGPEGEEWLSRWSLTLHKDLPWDSFPEPPKDMQTENDRIDPAP